MAARQGPRPRVTPAERQAELERHPEADPTPRYGDGKPYQPDDLVLHTSAPNAEPVRVFYVTRSQDVPPAYHATVDRLGRVQLSHLVLVRRGRLAP